MGTGAGCCDITEKPPGCCDIIGFIMGPRRGLGPPCCALGWNMRLPPDVMELGFGRTIGGCVKATLPGNGCSGLYGIGGCCGGMAVGCFAGLADSAPASSCSVIG